MKLTKKHIDVANDLTLGQLSHDDIAKKHGICRTTIYLWMKEKDFSEHLNQMSERHKRTAMCIANRWCIEAVKRLVHNITNKEIDPEVARKSAVDLLEMVGIKAKEGEEREIGSGPIFIIQSNHNNGSKTEDKSQRLSERFRLESGTVSGNDQFVGNG